MTAEPMTPAERTVAALLASACIHPPDEPCTECDERARKFVAAVRPYLISEFYEGMADGIERCGQITPEGLRALARLSYEQAPREDYP